MSTYSGNFGAVDDFFSGVSEYYYIRYALKKIAASAVASSVCASVVCSRCSSPAYQCQTNSVARQYAVLALRPVALSPAVRWTYSRPYSHPAPGAEHAPRSDHSPHPHSVQVPHQPRCCLAWCKRRTEAGFDLARVGKLGHDDDGGWCHRLCSSHQGDIRDGIHAAGSAILYRDTIHTGLP